MSITFRPAVRQNVQLLIGLMGGTSSGKTESAMKIATGLSGGDRFCVLDTEAGRALHKADRYQFDHADLEAPFTPEAYIDAIKKADEAGYKVIVVDSASHEYDGVGGVLEIQSDEFRRMGSREGARMASWIEPKRRHRAYVNALLQVRAHVILCHRAQDAIEIVKENGKTVVREKQSLTSVKGWLPICERRLPFELTLSILVRAENPGVPNIIKAEDDHRPMISLDRPLDAEVGRQLARWAAGETSNGVISAPQRKRLYSIATERGVPDDEVKRMIFEQAGVRSSKEIPRGAYDAVVAAVESFPSAGEDAAATASASGDVVSASPAPVEGSSGGAASGSPPLSPEEPSSLFVAPPMRETAA